MLNEQPYALQNKGVQFSIPRLYFIFFFDLLPFRGYDAYTDNDLVEIYKLLKASK